MTTLGAAVARNPITEEQEEAVYDLIENGDHDDLVAWLRDYVHALPYIPTSRALCDEVLDALAD